MLASLTLDRLLAPIAPAPAVRVVVFTGPSLPLDEARKRLPHAQVRPPIRRGDLPRAMAEGFDVVGIIDGTYVTERTVSAAEILHALDQGITLYGAASLGALRAVEFGAHGLQGIGIIHDWYQRGVTIRDDEVVVAMDPETFAARGQPLVNLRYACLHARRCGVIDEAVAGVLLDRYAAIPFAERHYSHLFRLVRSDDGVDPGVLDRFEAYIAARGETLDLKRRDALALVDRIADAFHIVP